VQAPYRPLYTVLQNYCDTVGVDRDVPVSTVTAHEEWTVEQSVL